MTEAECLQEIQATDRQGLINLWEAIESRTTEQAGWLPGKAFELLILRAFDLEGADVTWPFPVKLFGQIVEQIDGVVHVPEFNLSVMIESKDYQTGVDLAPIVKLRSQLQRRPAGVIGAVFTTNGFTEPALTLARFIAPQTILLWHPSDIDYCLPRASFKQGLVDKYRYCIEHGLPEKFLMT
jgi:Restriction endonuclease